MTDAEKKKRRLDRFEAKHPGALAEAAKRKRLASQMNRMYGISLDAYLTMYGAQGGRCVICRDLYERLSVDHCHETKVIRGLLCRHCNTALGFIRENVLIARALVGYIEDRCLPAKRLRLED